MTNQYAFGAFQKLPSNTYQQLVVANASIPLPSSPSKSSVRPSGQVLADALNDLDAPQLTEEPLRLSSLQQLLRDWITALVAANIAELAGLADDLRELDERLTNTDARAEQHAALHRVGLSLERVAVWGQTAGLAHAMQALGRRLLQLAAEAEAGAAH